MPVELTTRLILLRITGSGLFDPLHCLGHINDQARGNLASVDHTHKIFLLVDNRQKICVQAYHGFQRQPVIGVRHDRVIHGNPAGQFTERLPDLLTLAIETFFKFLVSIFAAAFQMQI